MQSAQSLRAADPSPARGSTPHWKSLFISLFTWLTLVANPAGAVPSITQAVTDQAGVLTDAQEAFLAGHLQAHHTATDTQLAVLIVQTTAGVPIEDFSHQVAEAWGGGTKGSDRGALFVLAVRDRRMRLELGRGLEPLITDGQARAIIDAIKPDLRTQQYARGVARVIEQVIARTGGAAVAIADAVPAGAPPPAAAPAPTAAPATTAAPSEAALADWRELKTLFEVAAWLLLGFLLVAGLYTLLWLRRRASSVTVFAFHQKNRWKFMLVGGLLINLDLFCWTFAFELDRPRELSYILGSLGGMLLVTPFFMVLVGGILHWIQRSYRHIEKSCDACSEPMTRWTSDSYGENSWADAQRSWSGGRYTHWACQCGESFSKIDHSYKRPRGSTSGGTDASAWSYSSSGYDSGFDSGFDMSSDFSGGGGSFDGGGASSSW